MNAADFYPAHSGPTLFELLLDSSKPLPGRFREIYGYEGADHDRLRCPLGTENSSRAILHTRQLDSAQ